LGWIIGGGLGIGVGVSRNAINPEQVPVVTKAENRTQAVQLALTVLRDRSRRERYLRIGDSGYYLAGFYQSTPFSDCSASENYVRIPVLEAADVDDLHALAERLVRKLDGVTV
jgi:curved DNA-binding protein CbpA